MLWQTGILKRALGCHRRAAKRTSERPCAGAGKCRASTATQCHAGRSTLHRQYPASVSLIAPAVGFGVKAWRSDRFFGLGQIASIAYSSRLCCCMVWVRITVLSGLCKPMSQDSIRPPSPYAIMLTLFETAS